VQLGLAGKDLNSDIAELVRRGLDAKIQMAWDSVRVIGNEAVHPGVLDLKGDVETVKCLFELINEIANELISKEKRIEAVYAKVPPQKREEIEKRDKGICKTKSNIFENYNLQKS